jgi:hypothetical protein
MIVVNKIFRILSARIASMAVTKLGTMVCRRDEELTSSLKAVIESHCAQEENMLNTNLSA